MMNLDEERQAVIRRIKSARMLKSLSQKDLEDFGVNTHTLQAWELGRNPLTERGAERLVDALDKAGIDCTVQWLFTGLGFGPRLKEIISDAPYQKFVKNAEVIDWDLEKAIQIEIETFCQLNPQATVLRLADDAMAPFYSLGNYIGGIKIPREQFENYLGYDCIVETDKGTFFRRLVKRNADYALICLNVKTTMTEPVILPTQIASVAPIVWHRSKLTRP